MRSLLYGLRDLLYPGFCRACAARLAPADRDFCPACLALLCHDPHETCPRCSSSVGPFTDTTQGCARCRGERFAFDHAIRFGPYHGPLRDLILRAKQPGGIAVAEALGELWANAAESRLRALNPTAVIPIPLHWRRRWWRGFNQSEILANAISAKLDLPCLPHVLRRIRATPSQTIQVPSRRAENVRSAFRAIPEPSLRDATILLIDDVLTTGSTASEAARALLGIGVARIIVAVVGHG